MIEQSPATQSCALGGAGVPEAGLRTLTPARMTGGAAEKGISFEGRISLAAALGATLLSVAGNASVRLPEQETASWA
jgi:hypothetical protein